MTGDKGGAQALEDSKTRVKKLGLAKGATVAVGVEARAHYEHFR